MSSSLSIYDGVAIRWLVAQLLVKVKFLVHIHSPTAREERMGSRTEIHTPNWTKVKWHMFQMIHSNKTNKDCR